MAGRPIELRGVETHNLKQVDLDIPLRKLIALCGVSGSGKTSLALDTLYAEGQRRYIESFSVHTRQFLEQLEKPTAERIDNIPAAIAVTHANVSRSNRTTIGATTEIVDYLRLLYAKIGQLFCRNCGQRVEKHTSQTIAAKLGELPTGVRFMLAFALPREGAEQRLKILNERGFTRTLDQGGERLIVVDRLTAGSTTEKRLRDSLETAMSEGEGRCEVLIDATAQLPLSPWERAGVRAGREQQPEPLPSASTSANEQSHSPSPAAPPHPNPLPEGEGTGSAELLSGAATQASLSPWERAGVRAGRAQQPEPSPSASASDTEQSHSPSPAARPHPSPLPEGEGTGSAELLSGAATQASLSPWERAGVRAGRTGGADDAMETATPSTPPHPSPLPGGEGTSAQDLRQWRRVSFSNQLRCSHCNVAYAEPEPRRFSFNSPLGACPTCEGFGNLLDWDMDLIVPDPGKSLRDGAIAPWNSPSYAHELQELLALAPRYALPVDVPFSDLTAEQVQLIRRGVPERSFGGLEGFFAWLEKRKYKMHLRVFASRWRSARECPTCHGDRLNADALAWRLGGINIAEACRLKIDDAIDFFRKLPLTDHERRVGRTMLEQTSSRLGFLQQVGLGYLSLDRALKTLSGGEAQRVALTSALGSSLVNMLYVLDEPSVGLHPKDVTKLITAVEALRDRGNTVVVVEHEEDMLRAADWLIEVGPGAGAGGGKITFEGELPQLLAGNSLTGDFLAGRRGVSVPTNRRPTSRGWIKLLGAKGNNLKNLTAEFPLGVLCVVSGVSGAGKSTLVQDTLYGAVCKRHRKECDKPLPYDDIVGDSQVDEVVLVDQSPIGKSPRSNPVTYVKAFDFIRAAFAETVDARTHNYTAGHFSFNMGDGRCETCQGEGYVQIDMQFMADLFMKCSSCHGMRYRKEILAVKYRGRNIAEVLEKTVREAFSFFRGQPKLQGKLKQLIDVGLDYLPLGQGANTLSGGESQRLKLASYLTESSRSRTLFLLDEPTTGLHFADVVQLLDCFDALVNAGNSLVVVEHNLQLMRAADYILDMGPGAGEQGGTIIARGTPEQIAADPNSVTGQYLAPTLARGAIQ